jgi:hypothetical protein
LLWTRDHAGAGSSARLVLDAAGQLCVGYGVFPPGGIGVECYDDTGVLQWRRTYDVSFGYGETVMTSRPGGGVLVGGSVWNGTHYEARVLAITGTGDVAWGRNSAAVSDHDYAASRIASLPSGDVFVGIQESWQNRARAVGLRLDGAGALVYERPLDTGVEAAYVTGLGVDASGNAYLALAAGGYTGRLEARTVLLDPAGAIAGAAPTDRTPRHRPPPASWSRRRGRLRPGGTSTRH